jgi:vacuolar-type H+-ATPase subunit H
MPNDNPQASPEILKQIQATERQVERKLRAAERESASIVEDARIQSEALLAKTQHSLEERKTALIAEGIKQAEKEGERIISNARENAHKLKSDSMLRLDQAVDLVLERILPSVAEGQATRDQQPSTSSELNSKNLKAENIVRGET